MTPAQQRESLGVPDLPMFANVPKENMRKMYLDNAKELGEIAEKASRTKNGKLYGYTYEYWNERHSFYLKVAETFK